MTSYMRLPVCASRTRMVPSSEPEASIDPSGESATEVTSAVCPSRGPSATAPL
ncbi:hypothetical protein AG1IA_08386 [Rhizoctonia solani AG-1 IA]|uniref:Uncharacterized protein n=1 Tax=Thanatephorus cucumeris (strain AG1-IA) TaxID=983506 RepID=L8WMK6_THACA|nr:hypothetical protein AG1IA_08386 [Rhizoctonia solani AG-1 IA]